MSPVKVPANLPELVRTAFNRAKANGDVNFYPTQVAVLTPASTPFQLRFSPSLANKPKPPKPPPTPADDKTPAPFNPFENPPPAMTVTPIGPDHVLLLNKFAVVPEHTILATATFKPQTHLLDAADLAAAHACIRAYHDDDDQLFVFFNCGRHSGASQPHRHLQMLPASRMRDGLPDENGWGVLADGLLLRDGAELPFVTFAERTRGDMDGDELRGVYLRLYARACAAAGVRAEGQEEGEAGISYNLAMTGEAMVVCPRTAEGAAVFAADGVGGRKEVGFLGVNGTVLAGTALVKSQGEWDALRKDPGQLWEVLGGIGVRP